MSERADTHTLRVLRFTLPLDCQPSLNEWRRWHWAKRAKHQREVAERVAMEVVLARAGAREPRHQPPMERARLTAIFHFPTKARRDPSNYSLKFVADALVTANVLVDDDFTHLEEIVRMGGVAKPGHIEVEIEEIGEGSDDANTAP